MDEKDLTIDLIKGKISRRKYLKFVGLFLFYEAVVDPLIKKSQATISNAVNNTVSDGNEIEVGLARKLFGDFRSNYRFTPGTAHYLYPGTMHPDDVKAAKTLGEFGLNGIDKVEIVPDLFPLSTLTGNFFCLGSPNSNALARHALQYSYKTRNFADGFVRNPEPLIELPFEYALDAKGLLKRGATFKRYVHDKLLVGPNWGVRNNQTGDLIVPATGPDGFLVEDYLLISVLPNFFSKDSFARDEKIVVFGGVHGSGTKAISLLFRDRIALTELAKKVSVAPYWQALIKVARVALATDNFLEPVRIESDIAVEPIHVQRESIAKLFPAGFGGNGDD